MGQASHKADQTVLSEARTFAALYSPHLVPAESCKQKMVGSALHQPFICTGMQGL